MGTIVTFPDLRTQIGKAHIMIFLWVTRRAARIGVIKYTTRCRAAIVPNTAAISYEYANLALQTLVLLDKRVVLCLHLAEHVFIST